MALDYDDAFTKIAAVSNASADDVEKWKGQVLDLAGETAKAPKELADALYFLASAGLKANQIMPTLAASAKASAAGLGETADVAKLTANVLNAYAGSGIKAADVTDTLVAAVREGSADTDEFGTAIGRILPIASKAGIGFGDVAASLASLSNIGLDVNEGVTAMRGLFQSLVTPTSAAAAAMADVGLTAQDLLTSLHEQGLIGTLRMLDERVRSQTGSQSEYLAALHAIIPNVRSLTGALGLTSQQAERVDGVFGRVRDSTGSLNDAFNTTAESSGFKMKQAFADLQIVMIQLGDLILPVLVAIVQFIDDNWTPAWDAVSEAVKNAWDAVKPFAETIGSVLIPLFQMMWHTIQDRILPVFERIKPLLILIGGAFVVFATLILAQFALVVTAVGFVVDKFLDFVGFVRDKVVEPIVNFLGRVYDFVKDKLVAAWEFIKEPVLAVIGAIVGAIQHIITWIQRAIEWVHRLGTSFAEELAHMAVEAGVFADITVPSLPGGRTGPRPDLQHGGIVTRSGLAMVHRGEAFSGVHNEMGFGGINGDIVLQVDGVTFARITRDQLLKMKGSRGGALGLA